MLQNLPSIVCGHVLDPQPGDTVLDMCASPGNKTTHIAELMNDCGHIVALDKTPNKVIVLKRKIEKFGLKCVNCYAWDSTKAVCDNRQVDANRLVPPFGTKTFDRILLDAPCSALGNRPQLRNDITSKMLASYPVVQRKLFKAAVDLLKSGGILVYSTCTINVGENEDIVRWACEKFSDDIELVAAEPMLGGPGWSNVGLSDKQR